MPTIPTGKMERELKRLYMQWAHQLPKHERDLHNYVAKFERNSTDLIERMGGETARLGVMADFPAPRRLDLSLHVGTIYSDMELAAIQAQIATGLNPLDTARALQRAGVDKSFRRLERLARTETVSAYWKNSWDSIEGLGLVMLWGSEDGPRTCEWCRERDGMVMDSSSLRDHPNGRCTPLPTHPSQVDYVGSVRADGVIYKDPKWGKGIKGSIKPTSPEKEISAMEALDDYRVNSFQLNDDLRSKKPVTSSVKALDSLVKRSRLDEPTMVRRILSGDAAEDALKAANSGKTYKDLAYMSTQRTSHGSTADAVADYANLGGTPVQIMFKVGTDTPAMDVASALVGADGFYDEGEILLPRGTTLTPGKPRLGADGVWYILMQLKS